MNVKRGLFTLSIVAAVIVTAMATGSPAFAALSQYWTFDTDASNSVSGGIDGTFVGTAGVTNVSGEYLRGTGALKLSHDTASGDYVNIPGAAIPTYHPTAFTVSTWFKSDETLGSQATDTRQFLWETAPFYSSGAGMNTADHAIQWYMQGTPTIAKTGESAAINDGNWHHIAIVYDYPGGTVDYYLDGGDFGYANTTEVAGILTQPTTSMNIGNHRLGDGSRNWKGYIDDFAIFNGTIDGAGITGLYNGTYTPLNVPVTEGPPPPPDIPDTPLQAYWKFDSNYDSTVNNSFYQGTPQGGSYTSITNTSGQFIRGTGALKLDSGTDVGGESTYVNIDREVAAPVRDRQITVSAWYNFTDISGDGSDDRNFVYESSSTYGLSFALQKDTTSGDRDGEWFFQGITQDAVGPVVTPGEWNHVVMVLDMDAERIQYYHNGELFDDVPTIGNEITSMDGFHIGNHRAGDGTRDFDGYIDDVAVYHGVLSPQAVTELYNGTKTPQTVTIDEGLTPFEYAHIVEEGWTLERTVDFEDATGISFNATEGNIYVGRRNASISDGGVYTIAADDTVALAVAAEYPAGILVDPVDGDVFISEDNSGTITRLGSGETERASWVTEFTDATDDDPTGMAIVPDSYTGGLVPTGSVVSVDRGSGGFEEVWNWSLNTAEGETALVSDADMGDGVGNVFFDLADVAVNDSGIYVTDVGANKIYEITGTDTVEELTTSEALNAPRSMVVDPLSGDLLVMTGDAEVVRIDVDTGDMTTVIEYLGYTSTWANMFITPDGESLYIADSGRDVVYEFSFDAANPIPGDANDDGYVNVTDLGILATNYGIDSGMDWEDGDFTGDNAVDVSDLGILATYYGTVPDALTVPEPSIMIMLAGIVLSALCIHRRRK